MCSSSVYFGHAVSTTFFSPDTAKGELCRYRSHKNWQLSDDAVVEAVKYENGLLVVTLKKVVPDAQRRRVLDIG